MPSKIIINDNDKKMLIDLINQKKSTTEIVDIFNNKYSYKNIMTFANDIGIIEILSDNNKKYKSNKLKQYHMKNRIIRMNNIKLKFGDIIDDMVKDGKILQDIMNTTELTQIPLTNYLKYIGLNDHRVVNSKRVVGNKARINGKNNGMVGIELKPLTDDIVKYFKKLKDDGVYRNDICKKIKEKYNYGERKYKQLCEKYGYPKKNPRTGKNNPMYGKSPSILSGIGISGWILNDDDKYFFRSSLELKVFLYLIENNINFKISKHRIRYVDNFSNDKTYNPDIVINNVICEIKPSNMLKIESVKMKQKAAEQYCDKFKLKYEFITENTFDLSGITFDKIDSMINNNIIMLTDNKVKDNYKRLMEVFDEQ